MAAREALKVDAEAIIDLPTDEEKIQYVKQRLGNGPVLGFFDEQLAGKLRAELDGTVPIITVDEETDHRALRLLDKPPFKLVIAENEFAMRGIDYRCEKASMELVIGKSFSSTIQAWQGLNRVGRFRDQCTRVQFGGVDLIDHTQELR